MWKLQNNRLNNIKLISHASKILLRILQKILETFLIPELLIKQTGYRICRGTRYHIDNLRWMMEKARDHQREILACFIDYKKSFDCVDHQILWFLSKTWEYPRI